MASIIKLTLKFNKNMKLRENRQENENCYLMQRELTVEGGAQKKD